MSFPQKAQKMSQASSCVQLMGLVQGETQIVDCENHTILKIFKNLPTTKLCVNLLSPTYLMPVNFPTSGSFRSIKIFPFQSCTECRIINPISGKLLHIWLARPITSWKTGVNQRPVFVAEQSNNLVKNWKGIGCLSQIHSVAMQHCTDWFSYLQREKMSKHKSYWVCSLKSMGKYSWLLQSTQATSACSVLTISRQWISSAAFIIRTTLQAWSSPFLAFEKSVEVFKAVSRYIRL